MTGSSDPHAVVELDGLAVELLPEKALFIPELGLLAVSDIHLGKAETFARWGSGVPATVHHDDLERLSSLLRRTNAKELVVAGDLFHSRARSDWSYFSAWRSAHPDLTITLVRGNHDIMPEAQFEALGIVVRGELVCGGRLRFLHDPCARLLGLPPGMESPATFDICGHLHPAIRLPGVGRNLPKLPCFWLRRRDLILPAFGGFTGSSVIRPLPGQQVYAIAESKVLKLT